MKFFSAALLAVLACSWTALALADLSQRDLEEKRAAGLHLLSLAPNAEPVWKTMKDIIELKKQHKHFFDLTDVYRPGSHPTYPYGGPPSGTEIRFPRPRFQREVRRLTGRVRVQGMQSWLSTLTNFETRFCETQTGVDAAIWIRDTVARMIRSRPGCGATVSLVSHSWPQSSVVAKIPGRRPGPVTILGAHLDTIDDLDFTGRAPGADDDGSGVIDLMEAFRILVEDGFRPETPIEFHWYAAEEIGLKGSVAIATNYRETNVAVKAMLQFDMTAYTQPGLTPTVGLIADYTNANLNTFVASLIQEYTSLAWAYDVCGYGCSDHASWNRSGFPAAFPFESKFDSFNLNIHSAADTTEVDGFSWTQTVEFTKLAIAFAYELGKQ